MRILREFGYAISVTALAAVALMVLHGSAFADDWRMFDRRLGMFIHWGCYSVGGWHCQELMRKELTRADYEARFAPNFRAEKFNADEFVDVAFSAGAEYIVFTAKHHDGFCMWDTKTTDYKVTNTPVGKDIVRELADACGRRGIRLGFYYSNPDWHHPNAHNPKSTHQIALQPGDVPDLDRYAEYVKAQITELLTNYGEICCLFWDIPPKVARPEMDALVRRLQPKIMINDRGWDNSATADYSTPERDYACEFGRRHVEACDSVGVQSWGYRCNEDYHTLGYLTRSIDRYLSTGGNYLLNVGPKPDGTIPEEAKACMRGVGSWMRRVGDAFCGVETVTNVNATALNKVPWTATRRGGSYFIHFPKGLDACGVDLAPFDTLPKRAVLLNDGSELKTEIELFPMKALKTKCRSLHVMGIPADRFANEAMVIRLDYE